MRFNPARIYLPLISIIHFDSREISRELKGLTLTATLTEDIVENVTLLFVLILNLLIYWIFLVI